MRSGQLARAIVSGLLGRFGSLNLTKSVDNSKPRNYIRATVSEDIVERFFLGHPRGISSILGLGTAS
jgi:hypothetical protein